jgi:SAM-dependent methyltransferase
LFATCYENLITASDFKEFRVISLEKGKGKTDSDENLRIRIQEAKTHLDWAWKEIADNMGIGEERADYLKLVTSDKHRKIPAWLRVTIQEWLDKVLPTLLRLSADLWAFKLEPVALATLSTKIDDAFSRLDNAKALVVMTDVRERDEKRPIAVFPAEDILQLYQTHKNKMPKPILLYFLGKANRNFAIVDSSDSYADVRSLLRQHSMLLVRNKEKIISVLTREPEIPIYASAEEHAEEYAKTPFVEQVAEKLVQCLSPYIKEETRFLDVASGPGTLAFQAGLYALKKYEKEITVVATENIEEQKFISIFEDFKCKRKLKKTTILPYGRDDLNRYGSQFDVVAWNLVLPSVHALRELSKVLGPNGIVAVSFYDKSTLRDLYSIVSRAFWKVLRYIPIPKEETINVCELADYVAENSPDEGGNKSIEIREKHCLPFKARFRNSEAFLRFLHCASPYVVKCFASLDKYPEAKQTVWDTAKKLSERLYGAVDMPIDFYVNFVIGQKTEEKNKYEPEISRYAEQV